MDRTTAIECISKGDLVLHNNIPYIPKAYILRLTNNIWCHELELKSLKANSIIIADMEVVLSGKEVSDNAKL